MIFKKTPDQSIKIEGSKVSGVQIGGQAGGDVHATLSQQASQHSDEQGIGTEDVLELIGQMQSLIAQSTLPEEEKKKATRNLGTAKDELGSEKPDRELIASDIKRATKVFKDTEDAVVAGKTLFEEVQPIIKQLIPWLGVAAGFFF